MLNKNAKKYISPNEEILTNFDLVISHKFIDKNIFLTNFPNSIKNILAIKQDNQGSLWNNINHRTNSLLNYMGDLEAFRCEKIDSEEIILKNAYKLNKKYDNIYQFKKYIKLGKTHICHFQIRKNILQNKNFLIYNKKFNLEIFDLIRNKKRILINIDETQIDSLICFDVFLNHEKFIIGFGNDKGICNIFTVKKSDFIECLNSQNTSKIPKPSKNLRLVVSEKILNGNSINDFEDEEDEAGLFVNYIKFISENQLLTTSNDCYFKVNDLSKNISIQKYKNDFPINNCDISNDKNTLLCIGDSKSIKLVDLRSNKCVKSLNEHFDYGIVIKYNPYDNNYFASGNQDLCCKIWDIRNLDNGSFLTSCGIKDNIGDLDWINSHTLCYMENSIFSHVLDIKNNKIEDLIYCGFGNGIVHDKLNDNIYLNVYKGNEDDSGGILIYEMMKNKTINSFNNINL